MRKDVPHSSRSRDASAGPPPRGEEGQKTIGRGELEKGLWVKTVSLRSKAGISDSESSERQQRLRPFGVFYSCGFDHLYSQQLFVAVS